MKFSDYYQKILSAKHTTYHGSPTPGVCVGLPLTLYALGVLHIAMANGGPMICLFV